LRRRAADDSGDGISNIHSLPARKLAADHGLVQGIAERHCLIRVD
jgi:hypothetical protein